MKVKLFALGLLLSLGIVPSASALEDGYSQPRFSTAGAQYGQVVDLISLTSGSGNITAIRCNFVASTVKVKVKFFVDGGSEQVVTLSGNYFPLVDGRYDTFFIPMNVRFESSIQVQLDRTGSTGTGESACRASWGLD